MRYSQQYTQGMNSAQPTQQQQFQQTDTVIISEQQQFAKQNKQRKSASPLTKNESYYSPAFTNPTMNPKNLSLKGNQSHNYYPQPFQQRMSTSTISQIPQQIPVSNLTASAFSGFIQQQPGKVSPKHLLQIMQQPHPYQSQQQQQNQVNFSTQQQQALQPGIRRNTYQNGTTGSSPNTPIISQKPITHEPVQAQFKINTKRISKQSSQTMQPNIAQTTTTAYSSQQQTQQQHKIGYTCMEVDGQLVFPSYIDISKYMVNGGLDYSKCQFECRLVKQKKVLTNKVKYAYMLNEFFLICNEPYKKVPDKVIEVKPNNRIVWDYNRTKLPYRLTGFHLLDGKEVFEYLAEEIVLLKLKEIFSQRLFQARFQDEYEVLSQVGKGNYARVYSIRHRSTGQKFAVKCFEKQKLLGLEKGSLSLHNELKIMRNLRGHPNVIKLYEVFEGEQTFYFVMEILEGTSLYEEIKKHAQNPYKDDEVREIIGMLVDGIAYCASKNIMHRDIKPENLLFGKVNNQKVLKIVDFGLGAYADDDPYLFPKCGTPGFVAPEIANLVDKTKPYSTICDMFSVGVIFHILLTGEAVFPGKKFNEVLKKNKECEIDFEKKEYENLSVQAKDLLMRMLEKDPTRRITAADALHHPYFVNGKQIKKAPSTTDLSVFDTNKESEDLPKVREKQISMFTKPLRIPYLTKEGTSGSTDDNLNSFVTRDPLYTGQNQGRQRAESGNMYYTIGSLDKQNFDSSQASSAQKEQDKSKFHNASQQQKPVSEFTPGSRKHKESIAEEHEEEDEARGNKGNQKPENNDKMEEEN